jgi:ubiquinone/menaquinone biosynthesis C-methylase UbiE
MVAEYIARAGEELLPEIVPLTERASAASFRLLQDSLPRGLQDEERGLALERTLAHKISNSISYNWKADDIIHNLGIPESELNTPGFSILDVGAGEQRLAKTVERNGWKSRVYSVEPRLAISQEAEDQFARSPYDLSRLWPAHPLAIPALADDLPFANASFNRVYAHFSAPYYMDNPTEIRDSLAEMMRVLRSDDGIARIAPITSRHGRLVDSLLKSLGTNYRFTSVGPVTSASYGPEHGWLLETIPKI